MGPSTQYCFFFFLVLPIHPLVQIPSLDPPGPREGTGSAIEDANEFAIRPRSGKWMQGWPVRLVGIPQLAAHFVIPFRSWSAAG